MKPLKRNLILIGIFLTAFLIYEATSTEIFDSSPDFESDQLMTFQELNYLDIVEMDTSYYGEMALLNNKTLIFAGEQYNSPKMYDVSDPTNILDLGEISSILYPHHIASEGDLLFVSFPQKIQAYNLSDLNNPVLYKEYETTNYEVSSLEVYNGHLFTIYDYNFQAYLGVYNISTAEHWNWSAPSVEMYFNDLILDDSGLAIIGHNDGIMFLNVTNASSPEWIGEIETANYPTAIGFDKDILYLSDEAGLHVFDANDPTNIALIKDYSNIKNYSGVFFEEYYYTTILVHKDLLYGSNIYWQGSKVLNVSEGSDISIAFEMNVLTPTMMLVQNSTIYFYGRCADPNSEVVDQSPEPPLCLLTFNLSDTPNADVDGDGLNYVRETWLLGSDINKADTDDDGLPDSYEAEFYDYTIFKMSPESTLSPRVHDSANDVDIDDLTNLQEYQYGTNPMKSDTDGDQAGDGYEIEIGTDPLDNTSVPQETIDTGLIVFAVIGIALVVAMILMTVFQKKSPLNIFLSHAVINFEPYKIKEMSETLQTLEPVNKALYCELDMKGNIDDWMDEMVPLSHIFVFLATQKSVFKSPDCGREIRLAKANGLMMVPLRTDEVKWEDIGGIGLPTTGFDYPEGQTKEVFGKLKDYIKDLSVKMEKLLKVLKKNDIINLPSLDSPMEFEQGDAPKLAKILIKSHQITGVISRTGENFMGGSEITRMIKAYHKQKPEATTQELMEALNIDPVYEHEVEGLMKKPKKPLVKVEPPSSPDEKKISENATDPDENITDQAN